MAHPSFEEIIILCGAIFPCSLGCAPAGAAAALCAVLFFRRLACAGLAHVLLIDGIEGGERDNRKRTYGEYWPIVIRTRAVW